MLTDSHHNLPMRRCFDLARLGLSGVKTNPMVGAVIWKNDQVIGEGYHRLFGQAHAEVDAIQQVENEELDRASIYVSLEPCTHQGKTPPCVELIVRKGFGTCVISTADVNPVVRRNGIKILRQSDITTVTDVLVEEGRRLIRPFEVQQELGRPYIILKWAQSSDGYLTKIGQQIKISNAFSDRLVHAWRSQADAIFVGTETTLIDDPSLNNRLYSGPNPVRVCIDRHNRLPDHLQVFQPPIATWLFSNRKNPPNENVTLINLKDDSLVFVFEELYRRNIGSVLVEGGGKIHDACLAAGLWDECRVITGRNALKEGLAAPAVPILPECSFRLAGDVISIYRRKS